jgi:hypothetical protein
MVNTSILLYLEVTTTKNVSRLYRAPGILPVLRTHGAQTYGLQTIQPPNTWQSPIYSPQTFTVRPCIVSSVIKGHKCLSQIESGLH